MHRPEFVQLAANHGLHGQEARDFWEHCSQLSNRDIETMFNSFFVTKDSEREGIIRLLDADVPIGYALEVGCDPRYVTLPPRGYYGAADTIALHRGQVPLEYAAALGEMRRTGQEVAAFFAAGVPAEYAAAVGPGVESSTVVLGWQESLRPEYVSEI